MGVSIAAKGAIAVQNQKAFFVMFSQIEMFRKLTPQILSFTPRVSSQLNTTRSGIPHLMTFLYFRFVITTVSRLTGSLELGDEVRFSICCAVAFFVCGLETFAGIIL